MADSMTDSMANTPNVPTMGLSLQDIEMPTPPGVDWSFWTTLLGWSVLGLLMIVLLLWIGRRYYLPLQLSLQLQRLQHSALKSAAESADGELIIDKTQLWRLYGWAKLLQRHLGKTKAEMVSMESFMQRLNQLGFSQADVSRETYIQLIIQARVLLQKRAFLRLSAPVDSNMTSKDS